MAQPASPVQSGAQGSASYIPALDGLRAVAILLVVLSHLGLGRLLPGAFGVTLFFFISGYLITRQLMHRLYATHRIGLGGFYLRRALRLLPTSLVYILVAGLLYRAAGGQISAAGWLSALIYGANYYDLWSGFTSSLPGVRHPFNILWSLAIEEHFYLIWPVVLAMAWRTRWLLRGLLGVCVAGFLWRWLLFDACFSGHAALLCAPASTNSLWHFNQLYLSTDARLDSIAWGALLAAAEARQAGWVQSGAKTVALAVCVLAIGFLLPGPFARYVLRTSLQGAALLVLAPAILHRDGRLRRALCCPPAVVLGRMSYALYLWHWGALGFADWAAQGNRMLWMAMALPLSGLLTWLAYAGIEQPLLRLRRRAGSNAPLGLTG